MRTRRDRGGLSRREEQRQRQRMVAAERRDVDADMPLYLSRMPEPLDCAPAPVAPLPVTEGDR